VLALLEFKFGTNREYAVLANTPHCDSNCCCYNCYSCFPIRKACPLRVCLCSLPCSQRTQPLRNR
jgi:hypothetical protein